MLPPFTVGIRATSIGDYDIGGGDLNVPEALALDCVRALHADGVDVAMSYRMQADHGFAQQLVLLGGTVDRWPVLPIHINCAGDVERVEVLRGPQGTLYGRNATGGVVNVISTAPKKDFGGEIGTSYAYINAEFDEYYNRDPRNPAAPLNPNDPAGLGRTNLAGKKVPYVAEHSINLGLQYEAELGDGGRVTAAVNTSFHSEKFLREYNDYRIDRVPPGTKTDVTVTWHVADTGLKLTAYSTNLENRVERKNVYVSPGFIGESATTAYTKPRTLGVRADFSF